MTSLPSPAGDLRLGHVLQAAGLADLGEVIVLSHTIRPKDPASLRNLSEQGVLAYTRIQTRKTNIFPKEPPPLWLVFVAEGERGTHSRFYTTYENRGELPDEGTTENWAYDLHPSPLLGSLRNRLVIDWRRRSDRVGQARSEGKTAACRRNRRPDGRSVSRIRRRAPHLRRAAQGRG